MRRVVSRLLFTADLPLFAADVKKALTSELVLYWDDTVIYINKTRSCMRFYGTEKLALFTAHAGKGRDGLDEDGLLALLSSMTFVMHDHNIVNYNADFIFINIECNQHLQRDLKKLAEISKHEWAALLKELISSTIHGTTLSAFQKCSPAAAANTCRREYWIQRNPAPPDFLIFEKTGDSP